MIKSKIKKLLGIAVVCFGLLFNVSVYAKTVTIASWGGAYTESQKLDCTKNKIYYKSTIISWRGSSVG